MKSKEQSIVDLTRENIDRVAKIKELEAELMLTQNAIEKLLNEVSQPEKVDPKEGEWWYSDHGNPAICRVKNIGGSRVCYIDGSCVYHYEAYFSDRSSKDDVWSLNALERPATDDEITHFMGLHAERLGMKEGVKIKNKFGEYKLGGNSRGYEFTGGVFYRNGGQHLLRDSQGNWAEVVKDEKVVVNGVEMEYDGSFFTWKDSPFRLNKQWIESLYDLTNSPELKTILDGFKK